MIARVLAALLTLWAGMALAQEATYVTRDLGIDCVRAPCANWEARDARTGVATRFAGIEWMAPGAMPRADLAAGRLLVRGELVFGRYPPPDGRAPVLRINAIIGPSR